MSSGILPAGIIIIIPPPPGAVRYRDSATCDDSVEHEWFEECALEGSAVCEMLYATKVGGKPGLSQSEQAEQVLQWNQKSAAQGLSESMNKLARAYLKQLPSSLQYDREEAIRIYKRAVDRNAEPEACVPNPLCPACNAVRRVFAAGVEWMSSPLRVMLTRPATPMTS